MEHDNRLTDSERHIPPGCMSDDELSTFLELSDGTELRDAAESPQSRHLAACARCASEFALLQSFQSATASPSEAADVDWIEQQLAEQRFQSATAAESPRVESPDPESFWVRLFRPALVPGAAWAAASILVVALLGTYWQSTRPPSIGGPTGDPTVFRSGSIDAISPLGDVAAVPEVIICSAVDGAVSYSFEVSEVDRAVIWRGKSEDPSVEIPAVIREAALPRKTLLWRAQAFDGEGELIASSADTEFRVVMP